MYELDFNKDFNNQLHWDNAKKENVQTFFKAMQMLYPLFDSEEIAIVAKNDSSKAGLLYDLRGCYIATNPNEADHHVSTGKAIKDFDRDDAKVLLIHNHPEESGFSFFDLITFIYCDCVKEMYVDSDVVWYLLKHSGAYLNESDKNKTVDELQRIFAEISKNHLKDYESIDTEYENNLITQEEVKEKRRQVSFVIREETLSEADKRGVVKARLFAIQKKECVTKGVLSHGQTN